MDFTSSIPCPCCVIPTITIQLIGTAIALVYGQRYLLPESFVKTKKVVYWVTVIIAFLLSLLGILLLVLSVHDDWRSKAFAWFCGSCGRQKQPLDEFRCQILTADGNVHGRVMEFGPGPGTNFKCFETLKNDTTSTTTSNEEEEEKAEETTSSFVGVTMSMNIIEYVAIEPNLHFRESMEEEKEVRNLTFPLIFRGIPGEEVHDDNDDDDSSSEDEDTMLFDTIIATHVLCSVDSPWKVLTNVEKSLKVGGKFVFMEHVSAELGTFRSYLQQMFAPILYIVGNGCQFRNTEQILRDYFLILDEEDNKSDIYYDLEVTNFEAPMPIAILKPHIMGVVTKKQQEQQEEEDKEAEN